MHPNQEGDDPAEDHFVASAVMTNAGETSNAINLRSEGGTNSGAACQNQELIESITSLIKCEGNTGTLMGPYVQTTAKKTLWKRYCDGTDQKEEEDNLEKSLGK